MTNPRQYLSKSNFTLGVQCEKALWLNLHRSDLINPMSPSLEMRFSQGNMIGRMARELFSDGILISARANEYEVALSETKSALASKSTSIYEAAGLHKDVFIRADILNRTPTGWELIEVKESSKVEKHHLTDIAIQWWVLINNGVALEHAYLTHINSQYVRQGAVDIHELFIQEDVTDRVKLMLSEIENLVSQFKNIFTEKKLPEVQVGSRCSNPYPCRFDNHCWKDLSSTSIHYLPRITDKKRAVCRSAEISDMADMDESQKPTDNQMRWILAARSTEPLIDRTIIKSHLSHLSYPIYYLDFETLAPAIPMFDGVRPYQQVPFQASIRIESLANELNHLEYLAEEKSDFREAMARFLLSSIGDSGTVVTYNASFERARLQDLAVQFPQYEPKLRSIIERLWDLQEIFSDGGYTDQKMFGSYSIKYVLPVIVPSMTYEALNVKDGTEAQAAFTKLYDETIKVEEKNGIRKDLLEYCGQDTQAMVEIIKVLRGLIS